MTDIPRERFRSLVRFITIVVLGLVLAPGFTALLSLAITGTVTYPVVLYVQMGYCAMFGITGFMMHEKPSEPDPRSVARRIILAACYTFQVPVILLALLFLLLYFAGNQPHTLAATAEAMGGIMNVGDRAGFVLTTVVVSSAWLGWSMMWYGFGRPATPKKAPATPQDATFTPNLQDAP